MFTRCPECETTFRLSAQDLRRAGGKVRCGECETVFNALEYLEEEAERLAPVNTPWQTEPANDKQVAPDDEYATPSPDEASADTLYDDDYAGPIGEPADIQSGYRRTEPAFSATDESDVYDDDFGAGILVTDPDDAYLSNDDTAQTSDSETALDFNPAGEDAALAEKPEPGRDATEERWPNYAAPADDDDDDIVSFVTPTRSSTDYPEVSASVSTAIGIGLAAGDDEIDDDSERLADDEPGIDFDNEFDVIADDNSIEFIISGDLDDDGNPEAEFVAVTSTDEDSGNIDEDEPAPPSSAEIAAAAVDNDIEEFDDTIWERIPGVGSSESLTKEPLFVKAGQPEKPDTTGAGPEQRREPVILDETNGADATRATNPEDEDGDEGAQDKPDDDGDIDTLEFNAPADTWSGIFSRSNRAARAPDVSGDARPFPVISEAQVAAETEELDAWSRELQANDLDEAAADTNTDDDAVAAADDPADWVSELGEAAVGAEPGEEQDEWLAETSDDDRGEYAATPPAAFDDWVTEQNGHASVADAEQHNPAPAAISHGAESPIESDTGERLSDQANDSAAADAVRATDDKPDESTDIESVQESDHDDNRSLTAAFATGEIDEEEYDVQHIILADESEPDGAGLTQAFAAAGQEEPPPWQPDAHKQLPEENARASLWLVGGVLVLATLALQLVHYNRDALAGNLAWGQAIRVVYHKLGMELYPNWSLDDYEIRGSEAIAGESGPDIMDIRAQIAAIGKEPIGLPHIRVVLRDRWANPVAAKTVSPAEYAAPDSLPPDALLQPNETLAAHVSIIDPGSGAQGFELELCLPRRHTGLECTGRPFE